MRGTARLLYAFSALLLIAIGVILAFVPPRETLLTLVGDDAGYYFAIVRNYCLGHGFSFDRLHETNGFNPLMPLILIPVFGWFRPGLDIVQCYTAGVLVTWGFVVLAVVPLVRLVDRLLAREGVAEAPRALGAAAVVTLHAGFVAMKSYYGMDAFLVLAIGLLYFDCVGRRGLLAPGAGAAIVDGALLGLLLLARVDSLPFVVAALGLSMVSAGWGAGRWRAWIARTAVFAAMVTPYLVWGEVRFGTWMPVSARLKTSFPRLDLRHSLATVMHTSLNGPDRIAAFVGLLVGAWVLTTALPNLFGRERARAWFADPPRVALVTLALGITARLAWMFAFSRFDVQGSYFILVHPFLAMVTMVAAARFAGGRALPAACGVVVLVTAMLLAGKMHTSWQRVRMLAGDRNDDWATAGHIRERVGPNEVIYGGAFGLVGFAADRAWINGDGVANDRSYQDAIRDGALTGYLARNNVSYVVWGWDRRGPAGVTPDGRFHLRVSSGLYDVSDSLVMNEDDVLLRAPSLRGTNSEIWLMRWYPPPRSVR